MPTLGLKMTPGFVHIKVARYNRRPASRAALIGGVQVSAVCSRFLFRCNDEARLAN